MDKIERCMMTYEAFEASYKCKIFVLSDNINSKQEVQFDFGEGKVMAFLVTETDLYTLSPRQIQHKTCARALELLYKEETK